jgi:hypothetical protein
LEQGSISKPIIGNSGVFVVQLKTKTAAEDLSNYAGYKASLLNATKQNTQSKVADALRKTFELTDNRSQYY